MIAAIIAGSAAVLVVALMRPVPAGSSSPIAFAAEKKSLMSVTAMRVEKLDQCIIVGGKHDSDVVGHADPLWAAHQEPDGRAAQCSA